MFDMKADIGLKIVSDDGDIKKIIVRFPDDNEFIEWRRRKKILQKDLGRRNFEMQNATPSDYDLELATKLRRDEDGPEINNADALHVMNSLANCEVENRPEREGKTFVIEMTVRNKTLTTHTLRIPSTQDMMHHDGMRSSVIHGAYGFQEIRLNYQSSAELYDKLKVSASGYANDIPVVHKAEIINVLLQEVKALLSDDSESDDADQD